jgi:cell division septum initiation protein DivIVA
MTGGGARIIVLNVRAKESPMTASATDADKLARLDAEARRAWSAYRERIRELSGEEYDHVEDESWAELQARLNALERRRAVLTGAVPRR